MACRPTLPVGSTQHGSWISALVRDLESHRGRSLVIAGRSQPPAVHALAHAINHALGNIGETVSFHPSSERGPADQIGSLSELARDIRLAWSTHW